MVLNVTDEVIQGNPKYNVIENGDGTKTIELVNEVVHEGTNLNKALFDKVENVLSYNVPSVQTEVIPISDSSDVNGLIDSNTNNYVEETNNRFIADEVRV